MKAANQAGKLSSGWPTPWLFGCAAIPVRAQAQALVRVRARAACEHLKVVRGALIVKHVGELLGALNHFLVHVDLTDTLGVAVGEARVIVSLGGGWVDPVAHRSAPVPQLDLVRLGVERVDPLTRDHVEVLKFLVLHYAHRARRAGAIA